MGVLFRACRTSGGGGRLRISIALEAVCPARPGAGDTSVIYPKVSSKASLHSQEASDRRDALFAGAARLTLQQ